MSRTKIQGGVAFTKLQPQPAAEALLVHSESDITVGIYAVPSLTVDQVLAAYNAVVAGQGAIVVDSNDSGHFVVNQVDALNDEISIEILFYNNMLVTYTVTSDMVEVSGIPINKEDLVVSLSQPQSERKLIYDLCAWDNRIAKEIVVYDSDSGIYYNINGYKFENNLLTLHTIMEGESGLTSVVFSIAPNGSIMVI